MTGAALVDTNILVYRFDPRFPEKQARATAALRSGLRDDVVRVPHQAIVEFIAAVTRPRKSDGPLLSFTDAAREAEEIISQFPVLYPNAEVVRLASVAPRPTDCPGSTRTCGRTPSISGCRSCGPRTSSTTGSTAPCAPSIRCWTLDPERPDTNRCRRRSAPPCILFRSAPLNVPIVQRPRIQPFQGCDTGSNPVGDATFIRIVCGDWPG